MPHLPHPGRKGLRTGGCAQRSAPHCYGCLAFFGFFTEMRFVCCALFTCCVRCVMCFRWVLLLGLEVGCVCGMSGWALHLALCLCSVLGGHTWTWVSLVTVQSTGVQCFVCCDLLFGSRGWGGINE